MKTSFKKYRLGASTCGNCQFAKKEENHWECRRYPPQIFSNVGTIATEVIRTEILTEWPVVYKEEWCGEWEEKK